MPSKLPLLSLLLVLLSADILIQSQQHSKHTILVQSATHIAKEAIEDTHTATKLVEIAHAEEYAPPKTLTIPKIGLTANIVPVGLTNTNTMDVPNNFVDVGWYDLGYKPGEHGSAVLDGHYDNFHGQPAVFYYLDTLSKGDKIIVTDQHGKQFTYIVTDNEAYPVDGLPNQQIYASNDAARLNIITCHGYYDDTIATFTQRTVIYSVLQL